MTSRLGQSSGFLWTTTQEQQLTKSIPCEASRWKALLSSGNSKKGHNLEKRQGECIKIIRFSNETRNGRKMFRRPKLYNKQSNIKPSQTINMCPFCRTVSRSQKPTHNSRFECTVVENDKCCLLLSNTLPM